MSALAELGVDVYGRATAGAIHGALHVLGSTCTLEPTGDVTAATLDRAAERLRDAL